MTTVEPTVPGELGDRFAVALIVLDELVDGFEAFARNEADVFTRFDDRFRGLGDDAQARLAAEAGLDELDGLLGHLIELATTVRERRHDQVVAMLDDE
jgi:hypothetical protein